MAETPIAETFTERARRLLTEQPRQLEFTLSRAGLEVLVTDAERYANRNREEVAAIMRREEQAEWSKWEAQVDRLEAVFPGAQAWPIGEYGEHWVSVPGVKLPARKFNSRATTIYFKTPPGYPGAAPDRFYCSPDLRHAGGGMPSPALIDTFDGMSLMLCFWRVQSWDDRHCDLISYATAMARFFQAVSRTGHGIGEPEAPPRPPNIREVG